MGAGNDQLRTYQSEFIRQPRPASRSIGGIRLVTGSRRHSDDVYQKANAEYDALFDRVCHAEDDVIAASISSDADVIAKLRVVTQRVRLGSEVLEVLNHLRHQVEHYAIGGRQ